MPDVAPTEADGVPEKYSESFPTQFVPDGGVTVMSNVSPAAHPAPEVELPVIASVHVPTDALFWPMLT